MDFLSFKVQFIIGKTTNLFIEFIKPCMHRTKYIKINNFINCLTKWETTVIEMRLVSASQENSK